MSSGNFPITFLIKVSGGPQAAAAFNGIVKALQSLDPAAKKTISSLTAVDAAQKKISASTTRTQASLSSLSQGFSRLGSTTVSAISQTTKLGSIFGNVTTAATGTTNAITRMGGSFSSVNSGVNTATGGLTRMNTLMTQSVASTDKAIASTNVYGQTIGRLAATTGTAAAGIERLNIMYTTEGTAASAATAANNGFVGALTSVSTGATGAATAVGGISPALAQITSGFTTSGAAARNYSTTLTPMGTQSAAVAGETTKLGGAIDKTSSSASKGSGNFRGMGLSIAGTIRHASGLGLSMLMLKTATDESTGMAEMHAEAQLRVAEAETAAADAVAIYGEASAEAVSATAELEKAQRAEAMAARNAGLAMSDTIFFYGLIGSEITATAIPAIRLLIEHKKKLGAVAGTTGGIMEKLSGIFIKTGSGATTAASSTGKLAPALFNVAGGATMASGGFGKLGTAIKGVGFAAMLTPMGKIGLILTIITAAVLIFIGAYDKIRPVLIATSNAIVDSVKALQDFTTALKGALDVVLPISEREAEWAKSKEKVTAAQKNENKEVVTFGGNARKLFDDIGKLVGMTGQQVAALLGAADAYLGITDTTKKSSEATNEWTTVTNGATGALVKIRPSMVELGTAAGLTETQMAMLGAQTGVVADAILQQKSSMDKAATSNMALAAQYGFLNEAIGASHESLQAAVTAYEAASTHAEGLAAAQKILKGDVDKVTDAFSLQSAVLSKIPAGLKSTTSSLKSMNGILMTSGGAIIDLQSIMEGWSISQAGVLRDGNALWNAYSTQLKDSGFTAQQVADTLQTLGIITQEVHDAFLAKAEAMGEDVKKTEEEKTAVQSLNEEIVKLNNTLYTAEGRTAAFAEGKAQQVKVFKESQVALMQEFAALQEYSTQIASAEGQQTRFATGMADMTRKLMDERAAIDTNAGALIQFGNGLASGYVQQTAFNQGIIDGATELFEMEEATANVQGQLAAYNSALSTGYAQTTAFASGVADTNLEFAKQTVEIERTNGVIKALAQHLADGTARTQEYAAGQQEMVQAFVDAQLEILNTEGELDKMNEQLQKGIPQWQGYMQGAQDASRGLQEMQIETAALAGETLILEATVRSAAGTGILLANGFEQGRNSVAKLMVEMVKAEGEFAGVQDAGEKLLDVVGLDLPEGFQFTAEEITNLVGVARGAVGPLRELETTLNDMAKNVTSGLADALKEGKDEFKDALDELEDEIGVNLTSGMKDAIESATSADVLSESINKGMGVLVTLLGSADAKVEAPKFINRWVDSITQQIDRLPPAAQKSMGAFVNELHKLGAMVESGGDVNKVNAQLQTLVNMMPSLGGAIGLVGKDILAMGKQAGLSNEQLIQLGKGAAMSEEELLAAGVAVKDFNGNLVPAGTAIKTLDQALRELPAGGDMVNKSLGGMARQLLQTDAGMQTLAQSGRDVRVSLADLATVTVVDPLTGMERVFANINGTMIEFGPNAQTAKGGIDSIATSAGTAAGPLALVTQELATLNRSATIYLGGLQTIVTTTFTAINTTIMTSMQTFQANVTTGFAAVNTAVTTYMQGFQANVTTGFAMVNAAVATYMQGFQTNVTTGFAMVNAAVATYMQGFQANVTTGFAMVNQAVLTYMQGFLTNVTTTFAQVNAAVSTYMQGFQANITTVLAQVNQAALTYMQGFLANVTTELANVNAAATTYMQGLLQIVTDAFNTMNTNVQALVRAMNQAVQREFGNMSQSVTNLVKTMSSAVEKGFTDMSTKAQNVSKQMNQAVQREFGSMSQAVTNLVKKMASDVESAFQDMMDSALDVVEQGADDIVSAFEDMADSAGQAVDQLASDVESSMSSISSAMDDAASAADDLQNSIDSLHDKEITVTTRYKTVGAPPKRHGGADVINAQRGNTGIVTQPTTVPLGGGRNMMMGEGFHPEVVSVTPLTGGGRGIGSQLSDFGQNIMSKLEGRNLFMQEGGAYNTTTSQSGPGYNQSITQKGSGGGTNWARSSVTINGKTNTIEMKNGKIVTGGGDVVVTPPTPGGGGGGGNGGTGAGAPIPDVNIPGRTRITAGPGTGQYIDEVHNPAAARQVIFEVNHVTTLDGEVLVKNTRKYHYQDYGALT